MVLSVCCPVVLSDGPQRSAAQLCFPMVLSGPMPSCAVRAKPGEVKRLTVGLEESEHRR